MKKLILSIIIISLTALICLYTTNPEEYKFKNDDKNIEKIIIAKTTAQKNSQIESSNTNTTADLLENTVTEEITNIINNELEESGTIIEETTKEVPEITKETPILINQNTDVSTTTQEIQPTKEDENKITNNEEIKESQTTQEIEETDETSSKNKEDIKIIDGLYTIKDNSNFNLSIDKDNNIVLEDSKEENQTEWLLTLLKDNYYHIASSKDTNMLLQPSENSEFLTISETQNEDREKWSFEPQKEGIKIISKENNLCLDSENNLHLNECTENKETQLFYLNIKQEEYKDGTYIIKSILDKSKVMTISNDSKLPETKIELSKLNNTKSQIWNIIKIDNNYYKISSTLNSNLVINETETNNLETSKSNEKTTQKWNIKTNQDNTVTFISDTNMCISVIEDNLITSPCNDTDNQKFILEEYTEDLIYSGIDISVYQGNIDWKKVSESNIDFVIIRAGYGDNWTSQDDQKLIDNVKECEKYNIPYGLYLYSYAINLNGSTEININSESVSSEITHILRLLKTLEELNYHPTLKTKVFYDMEDDSTIYLGKEELTKMADKFCSEVENNNYKCGIYANKYWLTTNLDAKYLEEKYDIWLAEWLTEISSHEEAIKYIPTYDLTDYDFWQFSSTGTVSGITGNVDLNIGYNIFKNN